MPLNEIPTYLSPETRSLVDSTLERAWLELNNDAPADATRERQKLAGTIVGLMQWARAIPQSSYASHYMPLEEGARRAITRNCDTRRGNRQSLSGH